MTFTQFSKAPDRGDRTARHRPGGFLQLATFALLGFGGFAADASAQSLFTNPGFESDLTGWTNTGGSSIITGADVASGTKAVRTGTAQGGVQQEVAYISTAALNINVKAKLGAGVSGWSGIGVDFLRSDNTEISEVSSQVTATTYATWSLTNVTVPSGTAKLRFWTWKPGTTGYLFVDDVNVTGSSTPPPPPPPATPPPPPPTGTGNGLRGEYFNNKTLTAPVALTRTDTTVNFAWSGSPGTGIGTDNFSVRWTGQVQAATTGSYTFQTVSDDGIRLWVNNTQIINNWTDHAPTTNNSTAINLTGGTKYNLTLEFYEATGGAEARLRWITPGTTTAVVVPQSQLFAATGTTPPPPPPAGTNTITRVRFYPRSGNAGRMLNGRFTGSNTSETLNFVELGRINSTPADGAWTELTFGNTTYYRYVKYEAPAGGYGNVAEVEFYAGSTKLGGRKFGTVGSWGNDPNVTYLAALDGNTATYYDAATADGAYVGYDIEGSSTTPPPPPPPTSPPPPTPPPPAGAVLSYHLGNSLTDTINNMLEPVADSAGKNHTYIRTTIPGAPTDWIWDHPGSANGEPDYRTVYNTRFIHHQSTQPFSGHCRSIANEADYSGRFFREARRNNPDVQHWLYVQWPTRNNFTECWGAGAATWEAAVNGHVSYTEQVRQVMDDANVGKGILIVPGGLGLVRIKQALAAGQIPGMSGDFFALHFSDDLHLSERGQYMIALVFYACIYGESPEGRVTYKPSVLTDQQATVYKRNAWDAVRNYQWSGSFGKP